MRYLLMIAIAIFLSACDDSQTSTTTNIYNESNDTQEVVIPPSKILPIVKSPYGDGSITNPYIIKENALYSTNAETYFKTSPLDTGCKVTIASTNNEIYDIYAYDSRYDTLVLDNNNTFEVIYSGYQYIYIGSYVNTLFGFYSECFERE